GQGPRCRGRHQSSLEARATQPAESAGRAHPEGCADSHQQRDAAGSDDGERDACEVSGSGWKEASDCVAKRDGFGRDWEGLKAPSPYPHGRGRKKKKTRRSWLKKKNKKRKSLRVRSPRRRRSKRGARLRRRRTCRLMRARK